MTAEELKVLNNIVSGYFDFAEIQAIRHRPMYMEDYIKQLDGILSGTGEQILLDAGSISHQQAMEKAEKEYRKYQVKTLSPVEQAYLDTIKNWRKKPRRNRKKMTISTIERHSLTEMFQDSFSNVYLQTRNSFIIKHLRR